MKKFVGIIVSISGYTTIGITFNWDILNWKQTLGVVIAGILFDVGSRITEAADENVWPWDRA